MANKALRTLGILKLVIREALSQPVLSRTPEPSSEMDSQESVDGFHAAGAEDLTPVYCFNARAVSALAPRGASLVDLGCGSGQFLAYLAEHRPDLKITGLDLSEKMVAAGQKLMVEKGLSERVRLVVGDMRHFRATVAGPINLVTSVFSMHHLPNDDDLHLCLEEVGRTVRESGAGLWIFDHARPKQARTAEDFPEVFTPDASPTFRLDSCNSLKASWSFKELAQSLQQALGAPHEKSLARLLPLYQVHWRSCSMAGDEAAWQEKKLSQAARKDAEALADLFAAYPGKGGR
jgi:ubiquinone/menaquinone biosynthesis C-methylase UbiE